ncbi:tRNA (adenosine(37)-N6)-threonylcarbamoyltransferase complex ATPase subunit type 1 TsaE [Patescibacteria group bacterium]
MKITTSSERQTINFARQFTKELNGGEVIGLIGDLGAGKTVFTKGIALGLGIKKTITSPTFVLMKIYPVKNKTRIKNLFHIDTYRILDANDIMGIGIEDYLGQEDTVVVIEWADKIKKILPKNTKYITLENTNKNKRLIKY